MGITFLLGCLHVPPEKQKRVQQRDFERGEPGQFAVVALDDVVSAGVHVLPHVLFPSPLGRRCPAGADEGAGGAKRRGFARTLTPTPLTHKGTPYGRRGRGKLFISRSAR